MIWISAISFIVILGLLVVVHELGHFLAARAFRVGVEEFGFGFPPRLLGKKFGKTLYSLNAIPIGGFVKIKGIIEQDGSTPAGRTADDFMAQSLLKRFAILIAGIVMNYLLTIVLFTVGYVIGMPSQLGDLPVGARVSAAALTVTDIAADVPAAQAGLQVGDSVTAINDQSVVTVADVKTQLQSITAGDTVLVTIQRDDSPVVISAPTIALTDAQAGIGAYFVETGTVQLPIGSAVVAATKQTWRLTITLGVAFAGLLSSAIQGQDVSSAVAGPVGIATLTHQATQLGLVYVIQFAALLSLNLAIFNLLPFPPLDGGKLIFVVLEAIVRRPVPLRWQVVVHNIGFIIFLIFIMAVTIKDVIGLVS